MTEVRGAILLFLYINIIKGIYCMSDLISVIVPIYNGEKSILQCVESLQMQTYKNTELILVNDGSTDNTKNIIKELESKYDNIRTFNIENSGVSHARNVGIKKSMGKFVVFVDSDDCVCNEYIEKLYDVSQKYVDKLAICGMKLRGNDIDEVRVYDNNDEISLTGINSVLDLYVKHLLSSPTNKMYRRNILENIRFDEEHLNGEDLMFNLEYIKYVSGFCAVNKPLYVYNISDVGTLHSKCNAEKFDMIKKTYNSLMKYACDENSVTRLKKMICEEYVYSMRIFCMCEKKLVKTVKSITKCREYNEVIQYINDISDDRKLNFVLQLNNAYIITMYFIIKRLFKRG